MAAWWVFVGIALALFHVLLALRSAPFAPEYEGFRPRLLVVGVELLSGALVLTLVRTLRSAPKCGALLLWVFLVGVVLRGAMLFSTPVQEDDFYRYLWDGAVLAVGVNPYAWSPEQVLDGEISDTEAASRLEELAENSGDVIHRINHPWLRTIYPPVAQVFFALSYLIKPWSLTAWRLLLLVNDILLFSLLVYLLRAVELSPLWAVLYWWSPLVVKEIFNSAHMDVVVLPFVLGALLLAARSRPVIASGLLALGAGAKMWPVVLLPVILRPLLREPRRLVAAVALFAFTVGLMVLPVVRAGLGQDSGFRAYGERWEMNDALYMVFLWGSERVLGWLDVVSVPRHMAARAVVLAVLAVWIAWCLRRRPERLIDYVERSLLITAALFLLSPTQFPWYFVWVLPFLVIRPAWSLLVLATLLPIYYLRFHYAAEGPVESLPNFLGWLDGFLHWSGPGRSVEVFDEGLVWLIYVPVWALIVWEWVWSLRGKSPWLSEVSEP